MVFANYKYRGKSLNNLGDQIQIHAIDCLYECMGIKKESIVYIDRHQLDTYDGDYAILPVTLPLADYTEGGWARKFSAKIIPVFLGLTFPNSELHAEEIEYLRKFQPIGCRDEHTLSIVRKYNIFAYLNGCITVTLPERTADLTRQKRVYIVDVDPNVISHIPKDLLENAEYRTNQVASSEDLSVNLKEKAIEIYNEIKANARLVITSLLHISVPSMAAGIPVILIPKQLLYRLCWLEKLLPIYSEDTIDTVDWNPSPVHYQGHKKQVLSNAIGQIKKTYEKYNNLFAISNFYENSSHLDDSGTLLFPFIEYMKNHWNHYDNYSYSIWGMTLFSEILVSYIERNYPNAKLVNVYDRFRSLVFRGIKTELPSKIERDTNDVIFITVFSKEALGMRNTVSESIRDRVVSAYPPPSPPSE